jgi:hypothetical protein
MTCTLRSPQTGSNHCWRESIPENVALTLSREGSSRVLMRHTNSRRLENILANRSASLARAAANTESAKAKMATSAASVAGTSREELSGTPVAQARRAELLHRTGRKIPLPTRKRPGGYTACMAKSSRPIAR